MKDAGGMRIQTQRPRLTAKVNLRGGQDRLRQMILYVSIRCVEAERYGLTKLNKIIWRADFEAFATRGTPITGREYQRLPQGPAPKEMRPLLDEMGKEGLIEYFETEFADGKKEMRPIAKIGPNLSYFTDEDIRFVDASILHYWDMTGTETSDDSHGIAWKSRENKAPMYYELSYLSDEEITQKQRAALLSKLRARGQIRGAH